MFVFGPKQYFFLIFFTDFVYGSFFPALAPTVIYNEKVKPAKNTTILPKNSNYFENFHK